MKKTIESRLSAQDPDYPRLTTLAEAIVAHAGGPARFRSAIPALLRQAIDEVIDTPRSRRFTLQEIEKTEKTYIGTKVEILLRNYLKLPKGKVLDLSVDGMEVDIKNTIGDNWTIPLEARGHPCLLLKSDEERSLCSVGIIVIRDSYLNPGQNQDKKATISKLGREHILWLLHEKPYPENFWQHLAPRIRETITAPFGGTDRLAALFRLVQGRPISRGLVQALAQQHDYMKRLRRNGGARDQLRAEGIALLWGGKKKDRALIHLLNLPKCSSAEFISSKPTTDAEISLLRDEGYID